MKRRALGAWLLPLMLAIPGALMLFQIENEGWSKPLFQSLMATTGEMSTRSLIASLLATPLLRVWPRAALTRWLRRHRRNFGLAAFAYALMHFSFYLVQHRSHFLMDLTKVSLLFGYLALLTMVPLASTSRNAAMKRLGERWGTLHRGAYLVALAGGIHWILMGSNKAVLLHFTPLVALEFNRVRLYLSLRKDRMSPPTRA